MQTLFENTNSFSCHTPRFWVVVERILNVSLQTYVSTFMLNIMLPASALGISIYTTVCVLWSFYQCDIDGVFHRWMAVSMSLSVLVVPLPS